MLFQEKIVNLMSDAGFMEVLDSTKKNLQHRSQQEFGEVLCFFNISCCTWQFEF
jgi:hypothetical protein